MTIKSDIARTLLEILEEMLLIIVHVRQSAGVMNLSQSLPVFLNQDNYRSQNGGYMVKTHSD